MNSVYVLYFFVHAVLNDELKSMLSSDSPINVSDIEMSTTLYILYRNYFNNKLYYENLFSDNNSILHERKISSVSISSHKYTIIIHFLN